MKHTHRYLVQVWSKEHGRYITDCGFHDGQIENALRYAYRVLSAAPHLVRIVDQKEPEFFIQVLQSAC